MRFSPFVIKSLIKGFGSLAVASGGSVGGWYIYDSVIDPKPKPKNLKIEDYFYPPRRNSCWKELFPNVYLSKKSVTKTDPKPDNDTSYQAPAIVPATPPSTDKELGCTVMKYSGSEKKKKWAFESETVIKNDKIGIIAWLDINSLESDNQRYQIYFLEKNDKENKWDVKFGFVSHEVSDLKKINSPDNKKIKLSYSNKWSSETDDGYYKYYGKWKSDQSKQKKFLEDLLESSSLSKFCAKYIYKDGKFYESTSPKDRKEILKKWFEPFKDKKGQWE